MWTPILSVLTAGICIVCLTGCVLLVRNAVHATELPGKQLRSHASQIESLQESVTLLSTELERLSQRVKMQRVRNATEHATSGPQRSGNGAMPDPHTQPNEWRAAMNRKLAEAKTGVKL